MEEIGRLRWEAGRYRAGLPGAPPEGEGEEGSREMKADLAKEAADLEVLIARDWEVLRSLAPSPPPLPSSTEPALPALEDELLHSLNNLALRASAHTTRTRTANQNLQAETLKISALTRRGRAGRRTARSGGGGGKPSLFASPFKVTCLEGQPPKLNGLRLMVKVPGGGAAEVPVFRPPGGETYGLAASFLRFSSPADQQQRRRQHQGCSPPGPQIHPPPPSASSSPVSPAWVAETNAAWSMALKLLAFKASELNLAVKGKLILTCPGKAIVRDGGGPGGGKPRVIVFGFEALRPSPAFAEVGESGGGAPESGGGAPTTNTTTNTQAQYPGGGEAKVRMLQALGVFHTLLVDLAGQITTSCPGGPRPPYVLEPGRMGNYALKNLKGDEDWEGVCRGVGVCLKWLGGV